MRQHECGLPGYTATRKPVTLLWKGEFEKREEAIAFERKIKGWSRAKKEALIAGDWNRIRELAKPKSRSEPARDTPFDKPVLSEVEGPVLSEVEGPVLSEVEGLRANGVVAGTDGLGANGVVAGTDGEKG